MSLNIVSDKFYKVQAEYIYDGTINFTEVGMTKYKFEKLPFKEKVKIIEKYTKYPKDALCQCTNIDIFTIK